MSAKKEKVVVELTKAYLNLNPGEIAGFDPDTARQLITQHAAVPYKPAEAEPAVRKSSTKGKASE